MLIYKKIVKYFEENADKPKDEVIKKLVGLGYKKSTAITYYSKHKDNIINLRIVAFDFFKNNPHVLDEMDNKKYYKKLGMSINTYTNYKSCYKAEVQKENKRLVEAKREKEIPKYGEKYYKGRLRQKLIFDDSRL